MWTDEFQNFIELLDVGDQAVKKAVGTALEMYLKPYRGTDREDAAKDLFELAAEHTGVRIQTKGTGRQAERTIEEPSSEAFRRRAERLVTGTGDAVLAKAVYFWFHTGPINRRYARHIDYALFGNRVTFEIYYGSPFPGINPEEVETPDIAEARNYTPRNEWRQILKDYAAFADVSVRLVHTGGLSIVGHADKTPLSDQEIRLGQEFYFEVKCPNDGLLAALQEVDGKYYRLDLAAAHYSLKVRSGINIVPFDAQKKLPVPLSETEDIGLHQFIFLFVRCTNIVNPFEQFELGKPVQSEHLSSLAKSLAKESVYNWAIKRINVMFR